MGNFFLLPCIGEINLFDKKEKSFLINECNFLMIVKERAALSINFELKLDRKFILLDFRWNFYKGPILEAIGWLRGRVSCVIGFKS